jgi:hypothetical protein
MSGRRFGRLPNWWSRSANGDDFLLMSLKSNDTGTGIAAMKCLLALSVLIDFFSNSRSLFKRYGRANRA